MDNVLVDFKSGLARASEEDLIKHKGDEDEIPGIFSTMDPMPGAVEAFHTLSKHFDTYILSTAHWENPSAWSDKLEWVKKHLGKLIGSFRSEGFAHETKRLIRLLVPNNVYVDDVRIWRAK